MTTELPTIDPSELDTVQGGIWPYLLGLAAVGVGAWLFSGANVGVVVGSNNRVAVGNNAPTTQGDNSPQK